MADTTDRSGIIRTRRDRNNPYTMVNKSVFENSSLSWEARGVLAYLLVKPDDWQVRTNDLLKQAPQSGPGKCGGDKLARILKELEDAGYLVRERRAAAGGRFEWITTLYENPLDAGEVREKTGRRRQRKQAPKAEQPYMAEPVMDENRITEPDRPYRENPVMDENSPYRDLPYMAEPYMAEPVIYKELNVLTTESHDKSERDVVSPRKARTKRPPEKDTTPSGIRTALATVCGIDLTVCSKEQVLQVNTTAKRIYTSGTRAGKTDDELIDRIRFTGRWYAKNDWRGKKGELPTPKTLVESWGAAMTDYRPPAPVNGYAPPPSTFPTDALTPAEVLARLTKAREANK